MNDAQQKINPKDWHYLGQWVDNVLDTDLWIHWAETDVLGKITNVKCGPNRISLNGHFFLWKAAYDAVMRESYAAAQQKDFAYFDNFCSVTKTITDELEIVKTTLSQKQGFSTDDLRVFFSSFQKLYTPWLIVFPIAAGLEKYLTEKVNEARMDLSSLGDHFHPSADPEMTKQIKEVRSFVQMLGEKELLHILKQESVTDICKELEKAFPDLVRLIQGHLKKYVWVGVHHFWGEPLTEEKILQEMRELSKQYPFVEYQAEKPAVSSEIQELITVMNKLSYWRFRCAEMSGYVVYHFLPRLKEISRKLGVTYEEMCWSARKEIFGALEDDNELDKNVIRERRKTFGYTYIDGEERIFSGKLVIQLLDALGIGVVAEVSIIKGNIACKGYAKGIVRVVREPKNVGVFQSGEILIAPETTPDFLPAMKKAAAFVTDIGGLTSHAAIIARELKKPCIIATKIATQVLKDGDLVEVDACPSSGAANEGVVRVLERTAETQDVFEEKDYLLEFEAKGLKPLFQDLMLESYYPEGTLMVCHDGILRSFICKKTVEKMGSVGIEMLRNDKENVFVTAASGISTGRNILVSCEYSESLSKEDVMGRLASFKEIARQYGFFNIAYLEQAYILARETRDEKLKARLKNIEGMKNRVKEDFNTVFFYPNSPWSAFIRHISRQFDIKEEDAHWYTMNEILDLFDGKEPSLQKIGDRRIVYALYMKDDTFVFIEGKQASEFITLFDQSDKRDDIRELSGIVANKSDGNIKGIVKIINVDYEKFSDTEQRIAEMKDGDVLVSRTTDPSLMSACRKASAIVTDVGGLLSHAAIISRELRIPCIVGTKIATKVLRDGDLVEVDACPSSGAADNGVVRILERKSS